MERAGDDLKILRDRFLLPQRFQVVFTDHILGLLEDLLITQKGSAIELFEQTVEKSFQGRF